VTQVPLIFPFFAFTSFLEDIPLPPFSLDSSLSSLGLEASYILPHLMGEGRGSGGRISPFFSYWTTLFFFFPSCFFDNFELEDLVRCSYIPPSSLLPSFCLYLLGLRGLA